jgi:hypothetical protein
LLASRVFTGTRWARTKFPAALSAGNRLKVDPVAGGKAVNHSESAFLQYHSIHCAFSFVNCLNWEFMEDCALWHRVDIVRPGRFFSPISEWGLRFGIGLLNR